MPLKNGRLTHQERNAAVAFVATGDKQEAARRAGLSRPGEGYRVLNRPAVQAEVHRLQMERLTNEAMPLAIDTLLACMRDAKAPWSNRNQAAKIVLDHTAGRDGAGGTKEAHEMTAAELQAKIAEYEARKVELAEPVEAQVLEAPDQGVLG